MSIKIKVHYLVIIVILLCLIYFGVQYMNDKKKHENFTNSLPENTSDKNYYSTNQSNSVYYPLQVDRNEVEEVDKIKSLFKNMNITSIQDLFQSITNLLHLDKWTGYWRNFDDSTKETTTGSGIYYQNLSGINSTNDNILVLRKIQDNIFFSLTRRAFLGNQFNDISGLTNSRYTFVGRATLDKSDKNKANIVEIYQDTYNQNTNNTSLESPRTGYITFTPKTTADPTDKISFTFNQNTINSFTKRSTVASGVSNFSETLPFYYDTTSTLFSDMECSSGKEKCTFTLNAGLTPYEACVPSGNKNIDGTCNITSNTDICYLNNTSTGDPLEYILNNETKTISKCNPNYYPLQNNSDYMINKFLNTSNLCSSDFSSLVTHSNTDTYLMYYLYDTNNIVDLSYQVWGFSYQDSKLTTQSTILSKLLYQYMVNSSNTSFKEWIMRQLNMANFNEIKDFTSTTSIDEKTANNILTWEVNKLYNNNNASCYFKLSTKPSQKSTSYYVNYDNTKGTVGVTVLSGGNQNSLLLSDFSSYTGGGISAYMGYLKNNLLFISPGNSVEQDFNPIMGINTNVCKLVSTMNVPGKWLILKIPKPNDMSKTFLDVLKGT